MGVRPPKFPQLVRQPRLANSDVALPTAQQRDTARQAPAQVLLGIEIRRLRMRLGVSQRQLVRVLGLQAHSNISDYENGRRIPPGDIVTACERVLNAPPGYLLRLRAAALSDRASQWRSRQLPEQRRQY